MKNIQKAHNLKGPIKNKLKTHNLKGNTEVLFLERIKKSIYVVMKLIANTLKSIHSKKATNSNYKKGNLPTKENLTIYKDLTNHKDLTKKENFNV